jgi:hypothetical protein
MKAEVANGLSFTDDDVVNKDDFIPKGEYNPHKVHPFVIHDHGFVVCVVFASHLQDALDIAVDNHKLDDFLIEEEWNTPGTKGLPAADYPTLGTENEEGIARLGNASEPFDIEALDVVELDNPPFSFVALYNAAKE